MADIQPLVADSTLTFEGQVSKINEIIDALGEALPIRDGVATNLSAANTTPSSANSYVTKMYVESTYVSNNYVNANLLAKNMLVINW